MITIPMNYSLKIFLKTNLISSFNQVIVINSLSLRSLMYWPPDSRINLSLGHHLEGRFFALTNNRFQTTNTCNNHQTSLQNDLEKYRIPICKISFLKSIRQCQNQQKYNMIYKNLPNALPYHKISTLFHPLFHFRLTPLMALMASKRPVTQQGLHRLCHRATHSGLHRAFLSRLLAMDTSENKENSESTWKYYADLCCTW